MPVAMRQDLLEGVIDDRGTLCSPWRSILLDGFRCCSFPGNQGARVGVQHKNILQRQRALLVLAYVLVVFGLRRLGDIVCRFGSPAFCWLVSQSKGLTPVSLCPSFSSKPTGTRSASLPKALMSASGWKGK